MKTLLESSYDVLFTEATNIKLTIPYPVDLPRDDGKGDYAAFNKARSQAKAHAQKNGFKYVKDDEDERDEQLNVTFSGDVSKLIAHVRVWTRDKNSSDQQIIKMYKEDEDLNEEYSVHAPVAKLNSLRKAISKIPNDKLDYILSVIAAHANNKQIKEIIEFMKK
jgi:hypothetical protein